MRRAALILSAIALSLSGCYSGPDPNLTESGKGLPEVTASMPEKASPGDTVEAVVTVTNPGPAAIDEVVVAFSRIGDPDLPVPIVEVGAGGQSEGVAGVTPKPIAISPDGVIYRFEGLAEGDSMDITFELVMPRAEGEIGNAVTVYDGAEPERARGTRLATTL